MVGFTAKRLIPYVHQRVGDGLRTVIVVEGDGYDAIYLRDDLHRKHSKRILGEVVEMFRLDDPLFSPESENHPVGERRALLPYHENACIIQLPFSDTETILISVSQKAGRNLVGFIESYRKIVTENRKLARWTERPYIRNPNYAGRQPVQIENKRIGVQSTSRRKRTPYSRGIKISIHRQVNY